MTIAVLHLSPEGAVIGADSTSSVLNANGMHFFDFNQKVFEIGENSTFGLLTWGLGGLGSTSYRTIIANLADDLDTNPPVSVSDVAQRWIDRFWTAYSSFDPVKRVNQLNNKLPHNSGGSDQHEAARTRDEETEYDGLKRGLLVGFCITGYALPDRKIEAAFMSFDPLLAKPQLEVRGHEGSQWWGVPNIIDRLVYGADINLINAIARCGKWQGTPEEVFEIVAAQTLSPGSLPIRDAIDYVYSSIHCTIKAMKFSNMPQVCGGPIEIAVITSDRNFRWVRHKPWDAAITDGGL
mgnify:CR=1 FL=1